VKKIIRFVLSRCFALLVPLAIAAPPPLPPPQTISYQGYLTNAAGVPVNTPQVMTFRIYDDVVAGSPAAALWTGTEDPVPVTNGVFNVILGGPLQAPFPPTLLFDKPYFLSVKVIGEALEMSPRLPLQMSPYAYRAVVADAVSAAASIPGAQVTDAILQGGNTLGAAMSVGTNDNNSFSILANNVAALRVFPTATSPNLIGGYAGNSVTAGVAAAVVSGGGSSGTFDLNTGAPCGVSCTNRVTDHGGSVGGGVGNQAGNATGTAIDAPYATVGGGLSNAASNFSSTVSGGYFNSASSNFSTVGGGHVNTASGGYSTVSGGTNNTAIGLYSTVGGGYTNTAGGNYSTVGGGYGTTASGAYSFAAGRQAKTQTAGASPVVHDGAFVWADFNFVDFNSTAANEFSARATGGVRFVTAINGTGVPTAGVTVGAGGGSWTTLSDRAAKKDIIAVDSRSILDCVASMPLYTWRYIAEVSGATHMGPVAQDFRAAFGLGDSDKTITTVDADGVALAAIQGLNQVVNEKEVEIKRQRVRIEMLEEALAAIQSRLGMR
jgi:hypothetical protein